MEKPEVLSHQIFFRVINYLVTSLVKPLLSRNFCQKNVRGKFCNFHAVILKYFIHSVEKHEILSRRIFFP